MNWEAAAKLLASVVLVFARIAEDSSDQSTKAALSGLDELLDAVRSGDVAKLDQASVLAQVAKLLDQIMVDRQTADAALDAKFPRKP